MLACERTLFVNDLAAAAYGILNNYNLQTRPLSQARTHTHTRTHAHAHTPTLFVNDLDAAAYGILNNYN